MRKTQDILSELAAELKFRSMRASGPGGQNVNKVNSKVELRWTPGISTRLREDIIQRFLELYGNRLTTDGELILSSGRYREQPRNREDCIERLLEMIEAARRPQKKRKRTKVPFGVEQARKRAKRIRSQKKVQRRPVQDRE